MTAGRQLVVTLDGLHGTVHPPDAPFLRADDPLLSRGDGVFETLLLRNGQPCLLEQHLVRLIRSAALLGLPDPDPRAWRAAVAVAVANWAEPGEAVLRLCHGRGRSGAVAFVMVSPLPERIFAARRGGISVVTLERGPAGEARPWSAASAKSSSYAVHVAALREAARLGADDAVYLDADGYVLEGPRSSVVVYADGRLLTPPPSLPILPGTTVQALFATAAERGLPCATAMLKPADLIAAQGVWLLSSLTLAARVHTLDGVALPAAPMSAQVAQLTVDAIGGTRADGG